ncbi:MAG: hypothetical protein WCB58_16855 [Acidobacteriaceae bacterium]
MIVTPVVDQANRIRKGWLKKGSIILLLYGRLGKRTAIFTHARTSERPLLPRSDRHEGTKDIQRVADRMLALRGVEPEKLVLTSSAKASRAAAQALA